MAPILLAIGGALAVYLKRRQGQTHPSDVLSTPPIPPQAAVITPARIAVHGDLMTNCNDPYKLKRAATLFGHEGLSYHAQALLQRAAILHDMMHGARAIVERCRAGDQHAMAMAKGIGEQARAGNKRSQVSALFIEQYAKQNPPKQAA